MFIAFLQGIALNAGLIIAIGAQNAYVIAQGMERRHPFAVAFVCSCCDALLIGCGLLLADAADTVGKNVLASLTLAGVLFLLWFGLRSAYAALSGQITQTSSYSSQSLRRAIVTSLALSLLNPHAILDMTIIFGGAAATLPADNRLPFAVGGMILSFAWFFTLAYGSARLSPLLTRPIAQRVLNAIVATIMLTTALLLITRLLND
ncbi:LysE family transporter [Candidatus Persebacteraceae bacterium Df01]|jgi:L-lysine exporter family protein LysE/ArgO|uniref:LysE family transporter n=1 Tax=Candidatus Doriopsillibacter californiensis TaxID=2970740 RepID=A0ABT7QMJ0_9GAMM|nr:LysE family transporter [Candidatus Persebacteraceae bacterium Df01]